MGWANCGEDSNGRPIGYAHEATCDHPECDAKIDRGLSYACGDMHGDDEVGCELYFCPRHLTIPDVPDEYLEALGRPGGIIVCEACCKLHEEAARGG